METGNPSFAEKYFKLDRKGHLAVLQLVSPDGTNKLGMRSIRALASAIKDLVVEAEDGSLRGLIFTGNEKFFSAGADLNEISRLTASQAFEFSRVGQELMLAIDRFPVPVIAAFAATAWAEAWTWLSPATTVSLPQTPCSAIAAQALE